VEEVGQSGEAELAGMDPKREFNGKIYIFEFQRLLTFRQEFENFYKEI
jgi:hypothetical protein